MIFLKTTTALHRFQVRHHMTHGYNSAMMWKPRSTSGPRTFVPLGLDAAQCSNSILRLIESSHGWGALAFDTVSSTWHPQGRIWKHEDEVGWRVTTAESEFSRQANSVGSRRTGTPRILSITILDDRTAMVKLLGIDGTQRYLTLLRLDPDEKNHGSNVANDGWLILQEVVVDEAAAHRTGRSAFTSLNQALQSYLDVEHGGGHVGRKKAQALFHPDASLIAVGTLSHEEQPTDWSAHTGTLLEISLLTYLDGVESQRPHEPQCRAPDTIVSMDVCGLAAAALVRVGNGAQTLVFDDVLLLGKDGIASDWRILSKAFSPKGWMQ